MIHDLGIHHSLEQYIIGKVSRPGADLYTRMTKRSPYQSDGWKLEASTINISGSEHGFDGSEG